MKNFYSKFRIVLLAGVLSLVYAFSVSAQIITSHPRNVEECEGIATISFAVSVNTKEYTKFSYKWYYIPYKSRTPIAVPNELAKGSEVTSKLVLTFDKTTIPLTTEFHNTQFFCVVTATPILGKLPVSEDSKAAILYVYTKPTITSNPSSATKNVGESVTFSVSASSTLSRTYQWQKDGINILGATSSSLTLNDLALTNAGAYRCRVSNSCGTVTSTSATLTVNDIIYEDGWFEQTSPTSQDIRKVDATDRFNSWAVTGDTDRLLKTSDGGETWSSFQTNYSGSPYWQSIEMLSSTNVFVGGYMVIGHTTNGGSNWSFYNVYTELGLDEYIYIYGIQFLNSSTGFAVGRGGLIIKTTDGGTTWVKQNWKNDASQVTDVDLRGLFFLDVNNGWAVGDNGVILQTTNGGSSWTKLPSFNTTPLNSVYFINSLTGYATGRGSYRHALKTTDGGTTWTSLSTLLPAGYPWDIQFIDSNNGYIAGQIYNYTTSTYEGSILKTKDGGATWYPQKVDNANQFYDMVMVNSDDGWAVGDAGEIQRTATGGCLTPTVNLFEDIEFCASGSHTMVADSFSNNLNCSYAWNTGSSAGSITVNETGNYSVTVTNLCNVTAEDDININVFPLPEANAGEDAVICDGDSTQLIASGGVTYSWNNGSYLSDVGIQNPLASPPVGTTNFTVTVTDENGCINTDAVSVTTNAIPTSSFSAPDFTCGDESASFDHTGTGGINNFYWTFEDSLTSSNTDTGNPQASWAADNLGMKEVSLVVEKLGCYSDTSKAMIEVRVIPTADFEAPVAVCGLDQAILSYTGTAPADATYNWSAPGGSITGSGQSIEVNYATGGTKTVGLEVVQAECSSGSMEKDLEVGYPYEGEKICIVTVDLETGKNMVVWEKTYDVGTDHFNVYRLGTGGIYNLLGEVDFDSLSVFVDMTSDPEKTQYSYKISAVDTCGNESAKSNYHKTLFLQYTSSEGGVNLLWQDYVIENETVDFSDFNIYRGSDSTALTQIDVVSGSNVYTDTDPAAKSQRMYYRVAGVLPQPCDPAGLLAGKKAGSGPFVHSLSNLEDNKLKTGISNALAGSLNLQLYPNPFNENTMIYYSLDREMDVMVEVFNLVGERLAVLYNDTQYAGDHKIELKASDLNNQQGLYYVRLHFDGQSITRKLILK